MTRARALKSVIRARAAKTGERYTAARRHVLRALEGRAHARPAPAPPAAAPPPPAAPVKGAISEAKVIEKTGRDLAHWFGVLDRFDAVKKGHTASARHLNEDHGVDGWYSQGITVSYERARGMRALNQRPSGEYEFSVSKVVPAGVKAVVAAITAPRRRAQWTRGVEPALVKALVTSLRPSKTKGFRIRPDGLGGYRYKWDDTQVEFYLVPKPDGRSSIVVTQRKLPSAAAMEERRPQWKAAVAALATYLAAQDR